ncbi:MAG: hypothetical protein GY950_15360 [bacterium]|nr:hypothetical protein [bacterium]
MLKLKNNSGNGSKRVSLNSYMKRVSYFSIGVLFLVLLFITEALLRPVPPAANSSSKYRLNLENLRKSLYNKLSSVINKKHAVRLIGTL